MSEKELVRTLGGSNVGDQVLWNLPGVVVQVTRLVATPGERWSADQVLSKLPGVILQVLGLLRHLY